MARSTSTPTIATVADAAGVSVATVSRVVRGHPDVRATTREEVLRVIAELKYRPSPLARALVTGRSRTLGLLVSDLANPFYPALAKAIEARALEADHLVVICNTMDDPDITRRSVERLVDLRVAAIIHATVGPEESAVREAVGDIPLIYVNRRPSDPDSVSVVMDNQLGGALLARHLIERGHRRISLIAGPDSSSISNDRIEGFRAEIARRASPVQFDVLHTDLSRQQVASAAKELLERPAPPTAVVGTNDMVAIEAMEVFRVAGRSIPGDLALAGFDDIELARSRMIDLTSVAQDVDFLARGTVAAAIGEAPEGSPAPGVPTLKVRGSTGG